MRTTDQHNLMYAIKSKRSTFLITLLYTSLHRIYNYINEFQFHSLKVNNFFLFEFGEIYEFFIMTNETNENACFENLKKNDNKSSKYAGEFICQLSRQRKEIFFSNCWDKKLFFNRLFTPVSFIYLVCLF